jgi:hypothetical protein
MAFLSPFPFILRYLPAVMKPQSGSGSRPVGHSRQKQHYITPAVDCSNNFILNHALTTSGVMTIPDISPPPQSFGVDVSDKKG